MGRLEHHFVVFLLVHARSSLPIDYLSDSPRISVALAPNRHARIIPAYGGVGAQRYEIEDAPEQHTGDGALPGLIIAFFLRSRDMEGKWKDAQCICH